MTLTLSLTGSTDESIYRSSSSQRSRRSNKLAMSGLTARYNPRFLAASLLRTVVLLFLVARSSGDVRSEEKSYYGKLSGVIIPGFASTKLRAWSVLDCPYSPFDFNPLDAVWLDTTKVIYIYTP